jgi:hypothetical protein
MTKYASVENRDELYAIMDELTMAIRAMITKTGARGQSAESLLSLICRWVGEPQCFMMVGLDEEKRVVGFMFALSFWTWVDVVALWTVPGLGMEVRFEVFEMLKAWARTRGCSKIVATTTRKPRSALKYFFGPLGFKQVGILMESEA